MSNLKKLFAKHNLDKPNLKFKTESADISDLINQMSDDGLVVDHIDTSGDIIRVPVKASLDTRPDKLGQGEKSGWYFFHQTDNHWISVYGNWRTNQQWKFYSNTIRELNPTERAELNRKVEENLERAKEERRNKNNEVAIDCLKRLKNSKNVTEHEYLTEKGLKNNYGLTEINGSLICPVYSTRNTNKELRSLQYITTKNKRFVSASEVKSGIYTVGLGWDDWSNIKTIAVTEGLATALSVYESTGLPTICVFSANFGLSALENIRKFCDAEFLICFDHDKNGVGQARAKEICASLGKCLIRIPSKVGDYNDLFQEEGSNAVKNEILSEGYKFSQYSIKNFVGNPPPRRWLVDQSLELSKIALLCSIGGIGKSGITLKACLDINQGHGNFLGNRIMDQGNCVVISAEDDTDEIRRRVALLDKNNRRFETEYDTYVMCSSEMGKPLTLIKQDGVSGLHITPEAIELSNSLEAVDNLKLIVIDPVQSVVSAQLNDNEVAQLYAQYVASLSVKFGCSVLSVHHLNKSALSNTNDVLSARSSIRGATALTDSHRAVFVMYLDSEENTEEICFKEGIEYNRMAVVKSALVKANSEADMSIKTLIRRGFELELLDETKGSIGDINWD